MSAPQETPKGEKPKAVALLSGGLDSNLAVRMMLEQGVDVEAVAIKTPFCDFDCGKGCGHRVQEVAEELGVKLKTVYFGDEYLQMLKSPTHGFGSGMNPCIDCRAMMYRAAEDHMKKTGAEFIITGEVLHQRPMSQNGRALKIIEQETGLEGKVVRPLSGRVLPATLPAEQGLIKHEMLMDIKGRSRKGQLALAKRYGISEPPNAAGGCLLTDPAFSVRIRDLFSHTAGVPSLNDVELLKVGRHFRLSPVAKFIVGRNQAENEIIRALATEGDVLFEARDYVGPTGLLRGQMDNTEIQQLCCRIILRYSDAPQQGQYYVKESSMSVSHEILASPLPDEDLAQMRI